MTIFTWLSNLKNKLVLILGATVSVLLLYISALRKAALQKELTRQKNASKRRDRAWEALHDGINEENKPVKRGYFDDKSD